MSGDFFTDKLYNNPAIARASLSLPVGNTAEFVCRVDVPTGTQIQSGIVASTTTQLGMGTQTQLLDKIPSTSFTPLGQTGSVILDDETIMLEPILP